MPGKMDPNLQGAYNKAQQIQEMKKRNPRLDQMSAGDRVKTLLRKKGERGQPNPVDSKTKMRNDQAVKDLLESKGIFNLPTLKETGGPKEDLQEVSAQLGKASQLHGDQSKRVAGIAKGMKGEVGNPYMKRGKSKYGM
jgi:hypothetical protein